MGTYHKGYLNGELVTLEEKTNNNIHFLVNGSSDLIYYKVCLTQMMLKNEHNEVELRVFVFITSEESLVEVIHDANESLGLGYVKSEEDIEL